MGSYAWLVAMYRESLGLDPKGKYANTVLLGRLKLLRILITFVLVNFAWILFRLPSVSAAWVVLRKYSLGKDLACSCHPIPFYASFCWLYVW